jgi:hypothetical protein
MHHIAMHHYHHPPAAQLVLHAAVAAVCDFTTALYSCSQPIQKAIAKHLILAISNPCNLKPQSPTITALLPTTTPSQLQLTQPNAKRSSPTQRTQSKQLPPHCRHSHTHNTKETAATPTAPTQQPHPQQLQSEPYATIVLPQPTCQGCVTVERPLVCL